MERFDLGDTSSAIEVLDGQISVEEALAELGFDWSPGPVPAGSQSGISARDRFSQPALF